MTATGEPSDDDHAYFQAIEEIFVALRGSPLLLSPADWQVARRWYRDGVPLHLVDRVLGEVFAKRKERGTKGKISSLRYCAPAIEAAWSELRELTAPGERAEAAPFDVSARLRALAAALPEEIPDRETFASRITAIQGDPPSVEAQLAALDRELLAVAAKGLAEDARSEVEAEVEKALAIFVARFSGEERARSRERLTYQVLRQRQRLPVLSLFSPEADVT